MTSKQEFLDYVIHDVFSALPGVTHRSMFGGYGLYKDGTIFGIITSDSKLYLRVDDSNRADFEEAGSKPFSYKNKRTGKIGVMTYYQLPEEIMDDPQQAADWATKAYYASLNRKK